MHSISLSELNDFIRRVLALNFAEPLWVRAEINQVNQSRGHWYFNLVEKGEDQQIQAKVDGVLWANTYRKLRVKLGMTLEELLQDGVEVLLLVNVDFHERYGLKVVIEDIDPAFTIGKLAIKRQETLRKLKAEGLLEKNKAVTLPPVLQRIAVLSSETAAGYADFVQQLHNNNFGYAFSTRLFPVAVQGIKVVEEITGTLESLQKDYDWFDAVVIIRGGGSKLDLIGFDEYEVGRAIANSALPVLTGIGHEIDESVADMVANHALKTPTAVAEFLIQRNLLFENEMINLGQDIHRIAQALVKQELLVLEGKKQQISGAAKYRLQMEHLNLQNHFKSVQTEGKRSSTQAGLQLDFIEKQIKLLSPDRILERGFTLTTDKEGNIITSGKNLSDEAVLQTHFKDGKVTSKVIKS
ncbi:MAG: exodeoxyribonuclease VII large subunit [Saprospiraceae bacterium]|nr:exodeoxyribonuclease VII large subunit [Saprospiraceae bacterium]